jgi:RNA polymerase sigma factor (TIGR02999 family)
VAWSTGDEAARGRLIDAVYHELRGLARGYLRRERADHSLAPTALVHEAYLKLIDQRQVRWQNRAHFFAIAAQLMRRILVDHARTRGAAKRDGGQRVPLQDDQAMMDPPEVDLLDLDAALEKLSSLDPRQSEAVEHTGEGDAARPLFAERFNERDARISSDGEWIAYVSDESGREEVSIRRISGGERTVLSPGGGHQPVWRRDGAELFYVDPQGALSAVAVRRDAGGRLLPGVPVKLGVPAIGVGHWGTQYDVTRDGSRVYFLVLLR